MNQRDCEAWRAWQLLVRFFFAQRGHLPSSGAQFGLSPVQCHVLHLIDPRRPLPMSRLAATLSCDASNVTGLIDRLESRGLIRRRPSPHDRRVRVLHLTPAGARIRQQLLTRMSGPSLPLSRLTPGQQRTLVRLLERLIEDRTS
jgi:MarR family transcriptional regulator, organic hydroperoxide resistance regulator